MKEKICPETGEKCPLACNDVCYLKVAAEYIARRTNPLINVYASPSMAENLPRKEQNKLWEDLQKAVIKRIS